MTTRPTKAEMLAAAERRLEMSRNAMDASTFNGRGRTEKALRELAELRADMASAQRSMIHALERALEDARSGRLIAFAFCGVGLNEHAIAYAFDDEKPGEQMFLLGAIEKAQGEIRGAVTRYDYELGDDGIMFATPQWQRDNEATAMRLLACHSIEAPVELVATWTDEQVKLADIWAWTSYLSASDNDDVQVPPRPDFIPDAPDRSDRHPITGEPL